jgi:hypothetical protein
VFGINRYQYCYDHNKIIHTIEQTQHWKLVFGLFMGHNFKYNTKKLYMGPTGHETHILSRTWHKLNFMPSFLLMHCPYKPTFWPLTSMPALSLSSLAYFTCLPLMLTCWSSELALAIGFPKVVYFSFPPFAFFDYFIHVAIVHFTLQTTSSYFGTHGYLLIGLLSLEYRLRNFVP